MFNLGHLEDIPMTVNAMLVLDDIRLKDTLYNYHIEGYNPIKIEASDKKEALRVLWENGFITHAHEMTNQGKAYLRAFWRGNMPVYEWEWRFIPD